MDKQNFHYTYAFLKKCVENNLFGASKLFGNYFRENSLQGDIQGLLGMLIHELLIIRK